MKWFTEAKIGRRLGIGFGVAILLIAVVAITGVISLKVMSRNAEETVTRDYKKIQYANDARNAANNVTYIIGRMVTATDGAARDELKRKFDEAREVFKASMEGLAGLETTSEGKELIRKFGEQVALAREQNNRVIELSLAGKESEARVVYAGLPKMVEDYLKAADGVVRFNETHMEKNYKAASASAARARWVFILLGLVSLALGGLLSRVTTRSITVPLEAASAHVDRMAGGDFSVEVPEYARLRGDELGIFFRSVHAMTINLKKIITEVVTSAADVAAAGEQLSGSAEHLTKGAMGQSTRASQVASAATEMNQTCEDVAGNSSAIADAAGEAVKEAKSGQEIVDSAIREVEMIAEAVEEISGAVKDLGGQSEKIGAIVTAIEDIADQTNLLALNAAIEAARAGEHGRGFAVVADEVKKLAERTSASTTEIADMIGSMMSGVTTTIDSMRRARSRVATGVELSSRTQTALTRIITGIDGLYERIHQMASAIEQMNAVTTEITRDINEISGATQAAFSSSEEISGAAAALADLAGKLEGSVQDFKV